MIGRMGVTCYKLNGITDRVCAKLILMARAEEKIFRSPCLQCPQVEELVSMLLALKRRSRNRVTKARGNRGRADKGTSPYYSLYEGRRR